MIVVKFILFTYDDRTCHDAQPENAVIAFAFYDILDSLWNFIFLLQQCTVLSQVRLTGMPVSKNLVVLYFLMFIALLKL